MPEIDETETDVTFASLGVPAPLVAVLAQDGIISPFPVQAATLPDALAGRDILGRAQTGSGKTLGFSLPLVTRLANGRTAPGRPRGLVLVPTRELATQVHEVLRPLARAMGLGVTTIYGGVSYGPQVTALRRRTDIIVATPGRLADLINQGECDLADVEVMVIDEADQMADLGFLPIVRRLLESTPADGQRMLFSATLDAAIDVLVRRFLNNPATHSVNENSSPAEIEHHVLTIDPSKKLEVLAALVGGDKRSLVFTRTKHGAERLARQLTELGIPAAELHGNLRQGARARNLAAFSNGIARVMVATDIAARGIHVDGIDLVIHADPPAEHKAYVHRSGRTARGGADGVVVTLQMRSQAREVTAMMRKAGITPHTATPTTPSRTCCARSAARPRPGSRSRARSPSWSGRRTGWPPTGPAAPVDAAATDGAAGAGPATTGRAATARAAAAMAATATAATATPATGALLRATSLPATATSGRPVSRGDDRPARFDGDRGSDRGPRPERDRSDRPAGDRSYGDRSSEGRSYRDRSPEGVRLKAVRPTTTARRAASSAATSGRMAAAGRRRALLQRRPAVLGRTPVPRQPRRQEPPGGQRPERNDWWPRENRPASGNGPAGEYRRPGAAGGWRPAGPGGRTARPAATGPSATAGTASRAARIATDPGRGDRPSAGGRPGAARGRSGYSAGRNGTR